MRYCSIPDIGNLRKWFEKNFNKPCQYHDWCYDNINSRLYADMCLLRFMKQAVKDKSTRSKITVYYPTILLTFVFVRCYGWVRYKK